MWSIWDDETPNANHTCLRWWVLSDLVQKNASTVNTWLHIELNSADYKECTFYSDDMHAFDSVQGAQASIHCSVTDLAIFLMTHHDGTSSTASCRQDTIVSNLKLSNRIAQQLQGYWSPSQFGLCSSGQNMSNLLNCGSVVKRSDFQRVT